MLTIRSPIVLRHKKIPESKLIDSGIPLFYPRNRWSTPVREDHHYFRSGRSSDFRIVLLAAPSRLKSQWHCATFVPDYSDGLVPDFHGVPC